jgi:hypothetical protein
MGVQEQGAHVAAPTDPSVLSALTAIAPRLEALGSTRATRNVLLSPPNEIAVAARGIHRWGHPARGSYYRQRLAPLLFQGLQVHRRASLQCRIYEFAPSCSFINNGTDTTTMVERKINTIGRIELNSRENASNAGVWNACRWSAVPSQRTCEIPHRTHCAKMQWPPDLALVSQGFCGRC